MRCPNCQAEAGDAATCPSCGKPVAAAPDVPAAPAPADAVQTAAKEGWRRTALVVGIAVVLGVIAGYLAHEMIGPAQDPICGQLCNFADIPSVKTNAVWQRQVAEAHCKCELWPHNAPQPQSVPLQPLKPQDLQKTPVKP